MKLYGNKLSPFVRHCRIAFMESGLDVEFIEDTDYQMSKRLSPTQRIPFLEYELDGETRMLTDSSSIIRFIRECSGGSFLPTVDDLNDYCAINTLNDAQVNLFLLKKEGLGPENVKYLQRQQDRIQTGLQEFERRQWPTQPPWDDVVLRLVCFLDWVRFRKHFSLEPFPQLQGLLARFDEYGPFQETAPVEA
jgi:glutathione S-transferase